MKTNKLMDEIRKSTPADTNKQVDLCVAIANRVFELLQERNMKQRDFAKALGKTARFGYSGHQAAGTDCTALRADSLLYRGYPGEQGELSLEPAERGTGQGDGEDRQDESGRPGTAHRSESSG